MYGLQLFWGQFSQILKNHYNHFKLLFSFFFQAIFFKVLGYVTYIIKKRDL